MLGKKISYSIYLIKEEFVQNDRYLDDVAGCDHYSVSISGYPNADLYLKTVRSKQHSWSGLLPPGVSGVDWNKYRSCAFFGLFLMEINNRLFALTAGFGRHLLHPFSIENRFGFKAVLNSVDPKTIQQLSKTTLSDNPKRSIEQVAKGINISQFGIDGFTDLIQRVKGRSKIENLGLALDGEDALKISTAHELTELPELLSECLRFYNSDEYKNYFPEVDNLSEVKDKEQKSLLNTELDALLESELALASGGKDLSGDIWASIPEIIVDDNVECFTYKKAGDALRFYDIELIDLFKERYLKKNGDKKRDVTVSSLSRDQIFIRRVDGTIYPRWKAANCINAIIEDGNKKYFFLEGRWYRANANYINSLDQKIEAIPSLDLNFADWPQRVAEKDYLSSMPLTEAGDYVVLDQNNIRLEGQSPIEPCDLYTKDKRLIHLKRYGTSKVLGHLFNQGFVSGDLLLNSVEFREKFNEKVGEGYQISHFAPSDFTVAYVVGTKYPHDLNLPLFSKIALTKAHDALRKKGFNVTLDVCPMTLI